MNYTNHQIAEMFGKTFEEGIDDYSTTTGKVVVMKDIDLFFFMPRAETQLWQA